MLIRPYEHLDKVYCAGPLFNQIERDEMVQIADLLSDAGFEPFVPHRDGMEFALVHPYLVQQGYDPTAVGQLLHEAVFALDTYQVIMGCGSLVCNLNGRVPDEGAVSETAMAWTLGKPLVLYKDDCRSKVAGRDNPLVVGMTDFEVTNSLGDIPELLRQKHAVLQIRREFEIPCPPHLEAVLCRGQYLWEGLQSLGLHRPNDKVAGIIRDLFDPDANRLNGAWQTV